MNRRLPVCRSSVRAHFSRCLRWAYPGAASSSGWRQRKASRNTQNAEVFIDRRCKDAAGRYVIWTPKEVMFDSFDHLFHGPGIIFSSRVEGNWQLLGCGRGLDVRRTVKHGKSAPLYWLNVDTYRDPHNARSRWF